jgi:hypothetical protein
VELLKGIKLSGLVLHAITFVWEALTVDSNKDIVDIDGIEETATHLKCLVRPVIENVVKMFLHIYIYIFTGKLYTLTYACTLHAIFHGN